MTSSCISTQWKFCILLYFLFASNLFYSSNSNFTEVGYYGFIEKHVAVGLGNAMMNQLRVHPFLDFIVSTDRTKLIYIVKSSPNMTFYAVHGPLTRYVKVRIAHAPGMQGTFSPPSTLKESASKQSRQASRHVRHARAVMYVGIANPQWRGKRSRHSQRMRRPQLYVSGKRPIERHLTPYFHQTVRCNTNASQ